MSLSRRAFVGGLVGAGVGGCLIAKDLCRVYQQQQGLDKVLLIGVDGLRPDALLQAATPNIDSLIAEGAYSVEARTGLHTVSGPGWSNILTGVWEDKHGVKDNSFKGANYKEYQNIFTRLEEYEKSLYTYSVSDLTWFNDIIIPKADARIYHSFEEEGDLKVAETASRLLSHHNIDLMFAYFQGVDMAGHNYGFDPEVPEYLSEIETIDHYVGMLLESIKKRPAYDKEHWLTIFTSDHGGKGKSHDGVGEEAMKVPLIMHGPAVQKGEILPVPTQVDIAPTILAYFGVPIREEWGLDGKAVGLKESYIRTKSPK